MSEGGRNQTATALRRSPLFGGIALWVMAISAGMMAVARHEYTPGERALAMPLAEPFISPSDHRYCLLLFAHSRCACTAAGIEELSQLVSRVGDKVHVTVEFFEPENAMLSASESSAWRQAARIPGVALKVDTDARLAKRLGALTSGQVFLFDPQARLVFEGGITESRGCAGDNDSLDAVIAIIEGKNRPAGIVHRPVYGCALYRPASPGAHPSEARP